MDIYDAWNGSLEAIKKRVTGVGVWTALNVAIPVAYEDSTFVLGFRPQDVDLIGHLKQAGTRRVIEEELSRNLNSQVEVVLLNGVTISDWRAYQRRQEEIAKTQKTDFEKAKAHAEAAKAWDDVYEQLSREYAAIPNKALPQQRARLLEASVALIANAVRERGLDDASDRNLARCLERVATYTETPATIIARMVLKRAGKL